MPKFIEASSMLRELPLMMSSVVTCRMPRYEEAISPLLLRNSWVIYDIISAGLINELITIEDIKSRFIVVRGEVSLLERDVASFYGVETKAVNQAVRNNPDKFPAGFVVELSKSEVNDLRSKILTANISSKSRVSPKVFTERGLYMLATILKSKQAVAATLAIINAYAQLRSMVRDMEALQSLRDGSPEQAQQLTAAGHKLAELIGDNLSTDSTETTIELNLRKKKSVKSA